ncbi:hypothetical protein HF923_13850 [Acidithiobacillus ferriphilus]|nr:hypothetical protein [Acidithiobacillus ferriphilus]
MVRPRQRGEYSENGIKELKIGFGMERMPCGQERANAAFFRIGVIAHNLFVLFKHSALGEGWQRHRIATVRWRLFQVPGRLIRYAGAWVLKVAATFAEDFADIRARGYATLHELAPLNAPLYSWFNDHRLMEPLGYIPPAETEANYYRQQNRQASLAA